MKRRVLLAGVGLSSVGVGAAFGSGAFTTVSADRAVELNVDNDGSAQIIFKPGDGIGADRLVETDDSNAVDVIEFSRTDLNERSKTTFESALTVENNTKNDADAGFRVGLHVLDEDNIGGEDAEILDFRVDDGDGTRSIVSDESEVELAESDTAESSTAEIDVVVDLRDDSVNDGESEDDNDLADIDQVTFVVEAIDEE